MNLLKQSTPATVKIGPSSDAGGTEWNQSTDTWTALPDALISKNGGAFAVRNDGTAPVYDVYGMWTVELDAIDTDTLGRLAVVIPDVTDAEGALREFDVVPANVYDSLVGGTDYLQGDVMQVDGIAADTQIPDLVWDEPLTEATHDVGYSAGQRVRLLILTGNAAQGGTANTITLAAAESAEDNIFNQNIISVVSGTGAGQTRLIAEYDGTTKVVTVDTPWHITPDGTSIYEILPFSSILLSDHGIAQGGAAGSITLGAIASGNDDSYVGSVAYISSGTGDGQIRLITDYDGTTKVATVSPDWIVTPDTTSVYKVLPVGRVIVDSMTSTSLADIWTYGTRTLTTAATAGYTANDGGVLTIKRGDSMSVRITGLGDISGRSKLWFTVKVNQSDADADAIIQIEEGAGLLYLNGEPAAVPGNGIITVDDAVAGDITITLDETETEDLEPARSHYYDIQMYDGTDVITLTGGLAGIIADVTRAIS